MKKNKNEPKQSIYFDTSMLIGYFKKGDEQKHAKDVMQQAVNMIKNPEITVKIPLISLGECVIRLLYPSSELSILDSFQTLIERTLQAKTPVPDIKSYKIALELMQDDVQLKPTDALIVAQALADHTSEWLITTDSLLLDNRAIFKKKEEIGSNLKISDRFSKNRG